MRQVVVGTTSSTGKYVSTYSTSTCSKQADDERRGNGSDVSQAGAMQRSHMSNC
jgi:hypothetical protein